MGLAAATDGGLVGNAFMNVLQPYASRIPFMAVVGNHERASDFAQFKARFAGYNLTAAASTSSSPLWYSYNHGLLHVVNIDTEVFSYGTAAEVQAQYDWLYRDVHAINRAVTPWVVANGHKTRFMKGTDFSRLDTIFKTIGVDLYVVRRPSAPPPPAAASCVRASHSALPSPRPRPTLTGRACPQLPTDCAKR